MQHVLHRMAQHTPAKILRRVLRKKRIARWTKRFGLIHRAWRKENIRLAQEAYHTLEATGKLKGWQNEKKGLYIAAPSGTFYSITPETPRETFIQLGSLFHELRRLKPNTKEHKETEEHIQTTWKKLQSFLQGGEMAGFVMRARPTGMAAQHAYVEWASKRIALRECGINIKGKEGRALLKKIEEQPIYPDLHHIEPILGKLAPKYVRLFQEVAGQLTKAVKKTNK